jgi:thioredoxin 1
MENFKIIINQEIPVLVDFYATWCVPCNTLAPILKDLKAELGENISIIKVDVDKNPDLANLYQVRGVPTMILFKKGENLWRQSGVLSKNDLVKVIDPFL